MMHRPLLCQQKYRQAALLLITADSRSVEAEQIARDTFGSWAVQAGATLQQVKELLGHSTIMITEKHHAYLAPRNLQDAISKLDRFYNESCNENARGGQFRG